MTVGGLPGRDRANALAIAAAVIALPLAADLPAAAKFASLALSLGLVALAGPVTAIMLVCVALSISSTTLVIGSTEWSPLELALLGCGLAVGFAALLDLVRARSIRVLERWIGPRDLAFLAGMLAVLAVASIAWIADPDLRPDSVRALRRVIIEPLFLIPAFTDVRRRSAENQLIPWIGVPAVLTAGLTVIQVVTGRSTIDIGGIHRPVGTFTHPNNLAFYLDRAVWFTPILSLPLLRRYGRFAWILPALVILATVATMSRGAAIALGVGALILFWEAVRVRWRLFTGLIVLGLLIVFVSRYLAESGDSVDSRRTIWQASIDMIRDRPITGVGLDQFLGQYRLRYVRPEGWPERTTSHPHNVLLDYWLSLGVAGVAVLWLLLEATWTRFTAAMTRSTFSIERACVAMVAAGLAHGLIDNSFFLPYLATFTWIGLGLSTPAKADGDG